MDNGKQTKEPALENRSGVLLSDGGSSLTEQHALPTEAGGGKYSNRGEATIGRPTVLLLTSKSWQWLNVAPSIGLYRLQSDLVKAGIACDILDFDLETEEDYLRRLEDGGYDVVGMSITHINIERDLSTLATFRQAARRSGKKTLFLAGGQEATLNQKALLKSSLVDCVFSGFAEISFTRFLQTYWSTPELPLPEIAAQCDGVAWLDAQREVRCRPAILLTADTFRRFSYTNVLTSRIPYERYWEKVWANRILGFDHSSFVVETVRLYTSSHCPRKCGFCSSQSFLPESQNHPSRIFMLSANEVYDLVEHHVREYGAKGFLFSDDDFLIGNKAGLDRAVAFCQRVIEAKQKGDIPQEVLFFCQSRIADFLQKKEVNQELIQLLKAAGFDNTGLGVETFIERLLHVPSINKVGISVTDCCRVLDALLEQKLTPVLYLILGIPETTADELVESMRIASSYIRKGADVRVNACLNAYPGSPVERSGRYSIQYRHWSNPETGIDFPIEDFIIPNDSVIADIIPKILDATKHELEQIKAAHGWSKDFVPKSAVGLACFIATAGLLSRQDAVEEFRTIVDFLDAS